MKLTGVISLLSLLNIRSTLSLPGNTSSPFKSTNLRGSLQSRSDESSASMPRMEVVIEEGTASQWMLIDQPVETSRQCKHEDSLECLYDSSLTRFRDLHGKEVTCSISYAWEPEGVEAEKIETQRQWITRFASHLETAGCRVTLDLWDNLNSGSISRFVENVVTSEKVFLIGTPLLKLKAEQSFRVVYAEVKALIDRFQNEPEQLYLIVRDGEHGLAFPEVFKDNVSTDMRQESQYAGALMDMLAKAFGIDRRHPAFEQSQDIKMALVKAVSDVTKQTHQLRHLPVLNRNFVGRERELAQLGQLLASEKIGTITQVIAGLGGIGKTQLARAYAHHNPSYELMWWINAETTLDEDYRRLAKHLGIAIDQESQLIQEEVKAQVAKKESSLLIFDNVEDYGEVRPYIPELEGRHHVILTSRNKQVPTDWIRPLVLQELTEEETLILIYKMTRAKDKPAHQSYRDWEEVLRQDIVGYDELKAEALWLGHDLGYLPLAIVQACSFIGVNGSISQYRKVFRETQAVLFDSDEKPSDYHPSDPEVTLRTTWEIAITKLEKTIPMVREIVSYSAFMAPDDIPEEVILACLKTLSGSRQFDNLTFTKALKALSGQSLLTQDEGQFHVHRLVQAVGRMTLSEDRQKEIIESLLQTLNDLVDFDYYNLESWETIKGLKSHVESIIGYAKALGIEAKARERLLQNLGRYLSYVRNAHEEAIGYLVESMAICREEYGEEHTAIASSYNSIGLVYQAQGNLSEAMRYYQKALEIEEALLGERHTATAVTYYAIGQVYLAQGNLNEAMRYFLKALEINEEQLGEQHTLTANTYSVIGLVYQAQDNFSEAMRYFLKALEINEEQLGDRHTATAINYYSIGGVYHDQGNLSEAMRYYRKAFEINEEQLGDRHTHTAMTYHQIGLVYKDQGNLSEAMKYYQKALEINEEQLGNHHTETASTYNVIGQVYHAQGNLNEAMRYYQKALEINEEQLGDRHTATAMTYHQIGLVYRDKGNLSEAMRYYQKALEINEEQLGDHHTETAGTYHVIGQVYHAQGNLNEAMRYYQKALEIKEEQLGDHHIATARTYHVIGQVYHDQGNLSEAMKYYQKALDIKEALLGDRHTSTAISYHAIGNVYQAQGNLSEAIRYYQKALEIEEALLGDLHHRHDLSRDRASI